MNELNTVIDLLLQKLPFEFNVMIMLIITGYIFMPLFSLAFTLVAAYQRSKKKPYQQALTAAMVCFGLSVCAMYITSKHYISTNFTPYLIGEKTETKALEYDVLDTNIRLELLKMTDQTTSLIEQCDTPYQVDGKYVMPRIFDILQCLGVQ